MAPVRRTLVATWRVEGSSVVAKMVEVDDEVCGSSMGPSSSAAATRILDSGTRAGHVSGLVRGRADRVKREAGARTEIRGEKE